MVDIHGDATIDGGVNAEVKFPKGAEVKFPTLAGTRLSSGFWPPNGPAEKIGRVSIAVSDDLDRPWPDVTRIW